MLFKTLPLLLFLFVFPTLVFSADATQHAVDSGLILEKPARRIISLAPHTTELLYAAGAGQWIVGAVSYSDYPKEALAIPRVGGYQSFDYEAIVALRPDLIVAWKSGNPSSGLDKLRGLGIPVFVTEARSLNDIPELLMQLSQLTATQRQAEREALRYKQHLAQLRQRYASAKKLSVFYQIWRQPLMTVNGEHLMNKVIELCGGENIFAGLDLLAGSVGIESIIQRNPDVIMINSKPERFTTWSADWQKWKQLKAVKNNHVFMIDPDTMSRHSPRILLGAEEVCGKLDRVRHSRFQSHQKQ